ncbi:hypothetical protein CCACVL1_26613 [Corchorus capsularis]|uniref:Myb-like domain-containing protein n=1 Tax=Corchorus capsularis TaxID=210143 RepID=A0A1R3GE38_COCAP|nr:hypothetical protein CCACVL1_26613 [Corchorus capsularis]
MSSASKTPEPTPLRRSLRLLNRATPSKPQDFSARKPESKKTPAHSADKICRKLISSAPKTPESTPLRRSSRLLNLATPSKSQDLRAQKSESKKTPARPTDKISKKLIQPSNGSTNSVNSTSGSRRSARLQSGSFPNKPEKTKFVETKTEKGESGKNTGKHKEVERKEREIIVGLKAVTAASRESERREACERNENDGIKRNLKRKRDEGGGRNVQGWTREQELALQRAYFSAKPTPNFWKKVSKLVPGKSAQDCFDKIHSDHSTPIQHQPRSRAKKMNLSPIGDLSFSASKLLKATALGTKKSSCSKQKSHVVQRKTVRHLLQKHYNVDQGDEADLFSILEPNLSPSIHALPKVVLSTPENLLEKQGFLQKCQERSSSGSKKYQTKLGRKGNLVSPPVLKQIKNKALHERYIDQLHNREAKRKAESKRAEKKVLGKENNGSVQNHNIDEVRAAKNALVSDARYVINQLQRLQCVDNSFDLDNEDDEVGSDDDEGEFQL